jgi:mono/diheme cytochrome c family protein
MHAALVAALIAILSFSLFSPAHADTSEGSPGSADRRFALELPITPIVWKDVDGHAYNVQQFAHHKATVFLFTSTECPISNLYTPRILELAQAYMPRGVQFFLVNSNQEDSLPTVRRYTRERKFPFPAIKDNGTTLADHLGADRTPEAVILDSRGVVRYRGRIDDNKDRNKVFRRDVQEALDALLAGQTVARPRTLAFGCMIFHDTKPSHVAAQGAITYARDVAPILAQNCVACHRKGEVGPFALETYQQARTWAAQIKSYTAHRLMPPWKAAPGYGDFKDARTLSDKEIATLARWVDSGAPAGNLKALPPSPHFRSTTDWTLGPPDMIVQSGRPYHLAAEGRDVYREFVMPVDFKADRYVSAVDFKPDNRAVVHHIILFFDLSGKSAELDGKETEPGYTVPGVGIGIPQEQTVWVAGWAPGNTPGFLPTGTAFKIPAGAKLVLQVHYHKNGKQELDRSQVGLHFAQGRVDKTMRVWALINAGFDLKPGLAHQEVRQSLVLPVDVHVWSVSPHMHMLGRMMKMTATLPDGTHQPMVLVNDWDFNWQETYRYKEPLTLPKGTKIDLVALFDNSEQNPRQPTHPPKEVFWGEQTTDEMCIGFFVVTLDQEHLGVDAGAQPGTESTRL